MRHPGTRRLATLATVAFLLILGGARRAQAIVMPTDVRGVYHGFFQSLATRGLWGNVEFSIDEIRNRRWVGMVTMIFPAAPSPIPIPFPVEGTISASGEFTGVGKSDAGMVQFHGQISLLQGGAAIADSTYHFFPPSPVVPGAGVPTPDDGTATLLRNFVGDPNIAPPNLSGDWLGHYASFGDGGTGMFELPAVQQACEDRSVGRLSSSFFGTEIIDGNRDNPFYFLGSINGDGMFAVIGWDPMGDHFIVTGDYFQPTPDDGKASAEGVYALMFANGKTDRGRLFDWTQQLIPPDPCSGDIIR